MAGLNIVVLLWIACLLLTSPSAGAEARQSLKLVARILPRASLSLSHDQITFVGNEDQAVIPSQEGPVQVTVKGRGKAGFPLELSIGAASDLEGSGGRIPSSRVACSFNGEGASGGGVLGRERQVLARWSRNGLHTGNLRCVLNNPQCLVPGDYEASAVLTLMSP